jgi:hypothetical protein
MENDNIAKIIGWGIVCLIAYYLFPYIELFLALCGGWYLWQEYERSNQRNRH